MAHETLYKQTTKPAEGVAIGHVVADRDPKSGSEMVLKAVTPATTQPLSHLLPYPHPEVPMESSTTTPG